MNRRLLVASIATLIASPVLAQTNAPAANAAGGATESNGAAANGSPASQKHIKDTMQVGSLSLLMSRDALPKLTYPKLKQFADFEIAEQETVADVLKALQSNAAPNGSVPSPAEAELMQNLDDAQRAMIAKMREMKAGLAFDREYIQQQLDGHRKLLEIQETYLRAPDNLDQTNAAKLARGMIKEHLTLLGDLERMFGGSARMNSGPRSRRQP